MYKSKLQELCHQKSWKLPEYTTVKEGPPHDSRFQSSVLVNGFSFTSTTPARSSKLAQNDAAFTAFSHFTSPPPVVNLVNQLHSAPETVVQENEPEVSQTSVAAAAGIVARLSGSSPFIATPETDQIPANKGVFAAQESSKVTNELNINELTTPNAMVTSQTQESGVFAAARNDYSSLGSTSQTKEPEKILPVGNEGVVATSDNKYTGSTSHMEELQMNPTVRDENVVVDAIVNKYIDMPHLYKNQLQSYTQKRNIGFPEYSCQREGPPHACRFKCKVTVDGNTYESEEFYSTLQKAELAAAKIALMSLLPNGVERDESGYKNLLQELVQKKGHSLPTYATSKSGEDHMPTFVSQVEVGGEYFVGQEAKSKKQAESNAAKVAYMAINQRTFIMKPTLSPSRLQVEETSRAPSPLASQSGTFIMKPTLSPSRLQVEETTRAPSPLASQSSTFIMKPTLSPSRLQVEETTRAPSPLACQSSLQMEETTQASSPLASQSDFTVKSNSDPAIQQLVSNKRSDLSGNSNESLSCLPPSPKRREVQLSSSSSRADYLAFLREHVQPSMPVPEKHAEDYPDQSSTSKSVSSSSGTSFSSLNEFGRPTTEFASNSSSGSTLCSSIEHLVNASTTCETGVVIHPRQSSLSYPSGGSVLPCSNNDWVAVKFTPGSSN